jgi:hypothetical protein
MPTINELLIQIARLEERLAAKERVEGEKRKVEGELSDARVKVGRLEERLEAANARALSERERTEQERGRAERERGAAAYFARYGISQNAKLEVMHERLLESQTRSIENPEAGRKQPVIALLDASRSQEVRRVYQLPFETYPKVFKIVEVQRGNHVEKEIRRLCELDCVVIVEPQYFANGITIRDSIRKRLPEWTEEQLNVRLGGGCRNCDAFANFCFVVSRR